MLLCSKLDSSSKLSLNNGAGRGWEGALGPTMGRT